MLAAVGGWCASTSTGTAEYEYAYVGEIKYERIEAPRVPSWWTTPSTRDTDRLTREQRLRWAEEDAWLRRQLQLCVPPERG